MNEVYIFKKYILLLFLNFLECIEKRKKLTIQKTPCKSSQDIFLLKNNFNMLLTDDLIMIPAHLNVVGSAKNLQSQK